MPSYNTNFFGAEINTSEIADGAITPAKLNSSVVGIDNSTGKITAINSTNFTSLDASNLTNAGEITLIEEVDLSGGAATSISSSTLDLTAYSKLFVFWEAENATNEQDLQLTINSDTGNNYDSSYIYLADASAATHDGIAYVRVGRTINAQMASGYFFIDLNQDKKGIQGMGGFGKKTLAIAGEWLPSTPAAITSITLTSAANNLTTATTIRIYGIK